MHEAIKDFLLDEFLGADQDVQISDDRDLFKAEILDSMGIMLLIGFIEDEYEVEIDPDDVTIPNFETVNAIVALIESKQAAA